MGAPAIEWLRPGVGYAPEAARSMRRLERALGRAHGCNSSYRDWAKQQAMFDAWNRYVASGYRADLYPGHSRALDPRLSKHCLGLADDSDDWTTPGYIDLAADHGWIRTAANDPTERHHFEYQSWRDNHRYEPAPAGLEDSDDMPSLNDIFNTPFTKNNDGTDVTLAQLLTGLDQMAHRIPANVWAYGLTHPLAKGADGKALPIAAGDFLRYEPAEHANTRAALAKVAQADIDYETLKAEIAKAFPGLDPDAYAVAAADEFDRRARARLDAA